MKIFLGLLLFYACSIGIIEALPVENPAAPKLIEEGCFLSPGGFFNFRAGYEGDFVINVLMKHDTEADVDRIDHFRQNTQAALLTLGLHNRCDLYAVLGASKMKADWRFEEMTTHYSKIQMETHYDFSWSLGARAILFEWSNTSLSLDGRYFRTNAKILHMEKDGVSLDGKNCLFHCWQADLGLSHKISFFTPYVAAKYSKAKADVFTKGESLISGEGTNVKGLENKHTIGMAIGCALSSAKFFMLNIEARFFDEEAFTVTGEFRF